MKNSQVEVDAVQGVSNVAASAQYPTIVAPLSQLRHCDKYQMRNTATAAADEGLEALGESLCIVQLQNLIGYEVDDGTIAIPAGGRRLTGFQMQRDKGKISPDHPVKVMLIPEALAAQASLIENEHRAAPHLADIYSAYAKLRSSGMGVEEIALSQGVPVSRVQKLLALADVSPKLFDLFRQNSVSLATMQALASVPDHARQEAAWTATKHQSEDYRHYSIRRILAADEMPACSVLARYVKLADYEAAGGEVRRDLFAEDDDGVYVTNPALLTQLAATKLERSRKVKGLTQEGWGWIEYIPTFTQDMRKAYGGAQNSTDSTEQWDASVKALTGCVVHLQGDGTIAIERGLVRAEQRKALAALKKQSKAEGQEIKGLSLPAADTRPEHSQALLDRLAAQKVAAIQAELLKRSELPTRLFVAQMAGGAFGERDHSKRWFDADITSAAADLTRTDAALESSEAWKAIQAHEQMWKGLVPVDPQERTTWILEQPMDLVTRLQSYLVARSFYRYGSSWSNNSGKHIDSMAQLVDLDMAQWWTPTATSYFNHVSKAQIADALIASGETVVAGSMDDMKKAEFAQAAEVAIARKGWLPSPLHTHVVTTAPVVADDGNGGEAHE